MKKNYNIEFTDEVAYNANSKEDAIKQFRTEHGNNAVIINIES